MMPEIQVSTKEYKDLMKKRSKYDIHYEIKLTPKKSLCRMMNQGYEQPRTLLCYLFSYATIHNNEIISTIDFGDLCHYFKMLRAKDTKSKIASSLQPLIDNGIAKVPKELLNQVKSKY